MNFLADEGMDWGIVEQLRKDGHSVLWIAELSPSIPDEDVLVTAVASKAVLLTDDKDFGELVYRQRLAHTGVVLLRLDGMTNTAKAELVSRMVSMHGVAFASAFSVISPYEIRIRPTNR